MAQRRRGARRDSFPSRADRKIIHAPRRRNWHNQLARDGNAIAPVTPARVLYHLFLGVAEVDRLFAQTSS